MTSKLVKQLLYDIRFVSPEVGRTMAIAADYIMELESELAVYRPFGPATMQRIQERKSGKPSGSPA